MCDVPISPHTVAPAALICSLSTLCPVCWLLYRENIFLCCTHCVVTVIGKDPDSLSSWWTFNEALFMLQPQRERAEKCHTGPSRRAVWGWKHFEVRERLRGLITRLCCHSCQLPYQSKKEIRGWAWLQFSNTPKALKISWKHLWPLLLFIKQALFYFLPNPPAHNVLFSLSIKGKWSDTKRFTWCKMVNKSFSYIIWTCCPVENLKSVGTQGKKIPRRLLQPTFWHQWNNPQNSNLFLFISIVHISRIVKYE